MTSLFEQIRPVLNGDQLHLPVCKIPHAERLRKGPKSVHNQIFDAWLGMDTAGFVCTPMINFSTDKKNQVRVHGDEKLIKPSTLSGGISMDELVLVDPWLRRPFIRRPFIRREDASNPPYQLPVIDRFYLSHATMHDSVLMAQLTVRDIVAVTYMYPPADLRKVAPRIVLRKCAITGLTKDNQVVVQEIPYEVHVCMNMSDDDLRADVVKTHAHYLRSDLLARTNIIFPVATDAQSLITMLQDMRGESLSQIKTFGMAYIYYDVDGYKPWLLDVGGKTIP